MQPLQHILNHLYVDEQNVIINATYWQAFFEETFLSDLANAHNAYNDDNADKADNADNIDNAVKADNTGDEPNAAMPRSTPSPASTEGEDIIFLVFKDQHGSSHLNNSHNRISVLRRTWGVLVSMREYRDSLDWEATFYLNLICRLHCYLRISICQNPEDEKFFSLDMPKNIPLVRRIVKRVYAEPTEGETYLRPMAGNQSEGVNYAYPIIFFTVADFETAFDSLFLDVGQLLCVELVCVEQSNYGGGVDGDDGSSTNTTASFYMPVTEDENNIVLFQGSVSYEALARVHEKKFALRRGHPNLLLMRGPNDKGVAQVEVTSIHHESLPMELLRSGMRKLSFTTASSDSDPRLYGSSPGSDTKEKSLLCKITFVKMHWKLIVLDLFRHFRPPSDSFS